MKQDKYDGQRNLWNEYAKQTISKLFYRAYGMTTYGSPKLPNIGRQDHHKPKRYDQK